MTIIKFDFVKNLTGLPSGWNAIEDPTTTGLKIADLLDDVGGMTGYSFTLNATATSSSSAGLVDQDWFGVEEIVWEHFWFSASSNDFSIAGLTTGDNYSIDLAGLTTANRNVLFSDGTDSDTYLNPGGSTPITPNQAITLTGVVDGTGIINITGGVVSAFTYITYGILTVTPAASGPTLTGPASTTEQAATVAAGTDLDDVTIFSLISGTFSIEQTIDSATATTLNYVAESGVNDCTPSTPVSGVPMAATISAAGVTPYQIQQEADDEVNTPATFNITLNGEATHEVVQTMIAVANTAPGESIFGTDLIVVEDDMQAYVIKVANGMNITWADDGTFTTDADQTETITVSYFSAATGQWSCLDLTIKDTSIIAVGGIVSPIVSSIVSNIVRPITS